MAVGKVTVLNAALKKIGGGVIDLDSNAFKVALLESGQSIDATFTGVSGDARFSDLTDEASGTGYTAGGEALANVTWNQIGAVVTFGADPSTWTALDVTAKYGMIYKNGGNNDLLAFFDVDDSLPAGRVISGTDFTINWTGGMFTLTRID